MAITIGDVLRRGGAKSDLRPTSETYGALTELFDHANVALFEGRLRRPLFSLQRQNNSMGYFTPAQVENELKDTVDKLTLNPDYLRDASTLDVLVIIVHLQLHMDQVSSGTPSRGGYHNREFADMAKRIGLWPSDTGEPGGKETGQRISHFIVEGGHFHRLATEVESRGVRLRWREIEKKRADRQPIDGAASDESATSEREKRIRYICPAGDADNCVELWGREGARVICGYHGVLYEPG